MIDVLNILHGNVRPYASYFVYFFALIGFFSTSQYVFRYRSTFSPISFSQNRRNVSRTPNLLLEHIDRCPECVLFLFTHSNRSGQEMIWTIFNEISIDFQVTFYPLTMKLFYNQPIRFYEILASNSTALVVERRRSWLNLFENRSDLRPNSILWYFVQSLKRPVKIDSSSSWANRTKLILFYTKFFGNSFWYNSDEKSVYQNDLNPEFCPISSEACRVTADRQLFAQSDASLIHLRESIDFDHLKNFTRKSHQRFVFFLKESPIHSPILSQKQHGDLFNYTQTYRPDSDLTGTTLRDFFWLFDRKIWANLDFQSILNEKERGQILVAIISNCGGSSSRLEYINELKKFLPVDVYGRCGKKCPDVADCRQFVYSKYKFYLSFENSLCDEYVSEKFFLAIQSAKIVPIVLGWARYHEYVPTSAYIDVRNFSSPRALAEYVDYLDRNSTAYLQYFHWRQFALPIKMPKYVCELCLKLFLDDRDQRQQTWPRIDRFWNRQNQCHRFRRFSNGTWKMN